MGPYDDTDGHVRPRHHSRCLSDLQAHAVAALGELVGTFLFLYLSYAGSLMAANHISPQGTAGVMGSDTVLAISLAYGFALLVNVWAFYRISGGIFNPAITLGMCLAGQLPPMRSAFFVAAQLLACMCAGGLISCMFPGDIKSANTTLGSGTSVAQGCFIEMFLTAQLIFVVLMLAAEKSKDTFLAPVGIGLTLFVTMLVGVPYTGASLNPARSFGCAVAAAEFPGYHWIYWVGPCLGALLAAGFYRIVKFLHYEDANPGQDDHKPTVERNEGLPGLPY
ncbi:Aquaporin, Major Intrinsic Protein [Pleurostoma richardsiae]|uniref:Aquaporin, Major Intrinsic Protein n=1 Tax=Pleurostoma richardsiae TaxID=41990 RepID=A0AA38RL78_9PEZI|nr:Aquaporin, Major Intrinsic Protein [Pleurostoma richardsiae]